jgi:hypothetical protein
VTDRPTKLCLCGCGEEMRADDIHSYKKGHKRSRRPPPVRVRIAVVVSEDGKWCAFGADHHEPGQSVKVADDYQFGAGKRHTVWVEADVPLPIPDTVEGEVKP